MGEQYDLYWSFDRERFEEVRAALEKDSRASPVGLPMQRILFRPRPPRP